MMKLLQKDSRKKMTLGQDGNALVLLLAVNAVVYIFFAFVKVIYLVNDSTEQTFQAQVFSWLTIPAQPTVLGTRPWTIITYMFAHFDFLDLFSTVGWLWLFGYILQNLAGNRRLVPVYLYGGLVGGLVFLLSSNLIPAIKVNVNSVYPMMGGGPAVAAIAACITALAPNYRIFPMLKIPLWVLTILFTAVRIATLGQGNYPQGLAFVAGGGMGLLFAWQLRKGNDWGQWMSDVANWVNDLFNPNRKELSLSAREQLFYKANQEPFLKRPHVTQQRIDELLDKINSQGYYALTDEEKAFLKKASREDI